MSSSSAPNTGGFLPGNARVVLGVSSPGPSEMTINEIEGRKVAELGKDTELAFWARVRAKAQAKARQILEEAMVEAEAIREQARQEGLAQGQAQALQACEAQVAVMGGTLAGLLQGLEAERPALWERHRQEFTALLRLGVEKTLHTALDASRMEVLGNLLDQAVELLDTRAGFTVRVHPQDEQAVGQLLEQARLAHPALGPWRVKADPSLAAGGVRLESDAGVVDNCVDTRFAQIADLLERVRFSGDAPE